MADKWNTFSALETAKATKSEIDTLKQQLATLSIKARKHEQDAQTSARENAHSKAELAQKTLELKRLSIDSQKVKAEATKKLETSARENAKAKAELEMSQMEVKRVFAEWKQMELDSAAKAQASNKEHAILKDHLKKKDAELQEMAASLAKAHSDNAGLQGQKRQAIKLIEHLQAQVNAAEGHVHIEESGISEGDESWELV